MDREQMHQNMLKNLQAQGNVYLSEVATPGAVPTAVNPDEVQRDEDEWAQH